MEAVALVADEVEGRGAAAMGGTEREVAVSVDAPFETCTNGSARSKVVKLCCGDTLPQSGLGRN